MRIFESHRPAKFLRYSYNYIKEKQPILDVYLSAYVQVRCQGMKRSYIVQTHFSPAKSGVRLGQSRLRFAGFFEGLFELEDFLEEIKEMLGDRPDEAILLVPAGQMFHGIKERLKIMEQATGE